MRAKAFRSFNGGSVSLQAIRWAMQQPVEPGAKLVLIVLADRADSEGRGCILSQAKIAESSSMGVRTVRHHLASLEASGMIERSRRSRKDGSRTSDEFVLRISSNRATPHGALPAESAASLPAKSAGKPDLPAKSAASEGSLPAKSAGLVSTILETVDKPPVGPPTNGDGGKAKRRTKRCPESWEPNDAHRALAAELGVNFGLEIAKLRDHEFKEPKSDWDATARNWLRTAAERRPRKPNGGNGMLSYEPTRNPVTPPAPVKTRMQIEHEERIRRAVGGG